jgi:outer membrane protein assembly factor BamB
VPTSRSPASRRTVLATATSLALALALALPGCARDLELPPPPAGPALTGLDPSAAFAGELIEVAGRGFAADPAGNAVVFPGATARGERLTATGLLVRVPPDAGSGELRVTSDGGTSAPVAGFRYLGLGQLRVGKVIVARIPIVHQPAALLADGNALFLHSGLLDGLVQAGDSSFLGSSGLSSVPAAGDGALYWIGKDGLLHRRLTSTGEVIDVTPAGAGVSDLSLSQLAYRAGTGRLWAVGESSAGTVLAPLSPATLLPGGPRVPFPPLLDSPFVELPSGTLAAAGHAIAGDPVKLQWIDRFGSLTPRATTGTIPSIGVVLAAGTTAAGEAVAVATDDGAVEVLTEDGLDHWRLPTLTPTPVAALALEGDVVVVARTADGTVVGTHLATGATWGFATPRPTRLAVSGPVLWVASDADDVLVALDLSTGALLARRAVDVRPGVDPVLGGMAYTAGHLTVVTGRPGALVDFTLPSYVPTGLSTPFAPSLVAADPLTERLWLGGGAVVSSAGVISGPLAGIARRAVASGDGLAVAHDSGLAFVEASGAVHELATGATFPVGLATDRAGRLLYAATLVGGDTLQVYSPAALIAGGGSTQSVATPGLLLVGATFIDDQPWALFLDATLAPRAARLDATGQWVDDRARLSPDADALSSPNRRTLVTWELATVPGATGALQLWSADPATGFAPLSAVSLPAAVSGLAFDPTGERLYVVTRDPDLLLVVE